MSETAIFLWMAIPTIIVFFSIFGAILFGIDSLDVKYFFIDMGELIAKAVRRIIESRPVSKKKKQKYLKEYIQLTREKDINTNPHIYKISENESPEEFWNRKNLKSMTESFTKNSVFCIRQAKILRREFNKSGKIDKEVQENLCYLYENDKFSSQSRVKELEKMISETTVENKTEYDCINDNKKEIFATRRLVK